MLTLLRNIMVWNAVIEGLKGLAQAVQIGSTPTIIWTNPQLNTPVSDIIPTRFMQNGFAELFFYPDAANGKMNVDCVVADVSGNLTVTSKRIFSGLESGLFNAVAIPRSSTSLTLLITTKHVFPNTDVGIKVTRYFIDNTCTPIIPLSFVSTPIYYSVFSNPPLIFKNADQQIVSVPESSTSQNCNQTITNSPGITVDVETGIMKQENTSIPRRSTNIAPTLDGFAFSTLASTTNCPNSDSIIFSSSDGAILSSNPLNKTSNCAMKSTQAGHLITLCVPSRLVSLSNYAVLLSVYAPDHSLSATYAIKNGTNSVAYDSPSLDFSETNAAIYALWIEPVNTFPIFHAQPFTLDAKPITGLPEITFGPPNSFLKFGSIMALDGADVLITYLNNLQMNAMKLNWPNPAATFTTAALSTPQPTSLQSLSSANSTTAASGTLSTGASATSTLSAASQVSTTTEGTAQTQTSSPSAATPEPPADVVPGSTSPMKEGDNIGMIIGITVGAGFALSSLLMFLVFFLRHQRKSADNPELAASPVPRPVGLSIYDRVEVADLSDASQQHNQYTPGGVLQAQVAERNASYDALGQRLGDTLQRNGIFKHKHSGAAEYSSPPPPQNPEYHSARVDAPHNYDAISSTFN